MAPMRMLIRKGHHWADKVLWGVKIVGPIATLRGALRMAFLHLRRPKRSILRLGSGEILEFGFPNQMPTALLMFGDFIDPEFAFLRRVAKPGWVFVDVGAAIGQFTIFAAALSPASVHAFEPSGANIITLAGNVQRNGFADRVHIHPTAISNIQSEAYFNTAASTWGSGLSARGTELVSVRELSNELARLALEHVSVLKINVSGHEPQVLESADRFLSQGGVDILVLLLGLASLAWYARIASYGYRFFYFHPEEIALYEVSAFDANSVLDHRPWPARHIIAIHGQVIDHLLGGTISIRKAGVGPTAS